MEFDKKNLWSIIGIVCGIIIIIFGIITLSVDKGHLIDKSIKFGADFYTESYYATATSTNNISYLCDLISNGIGYLLLAIGLTDICLFGAKMTIKKTIVCEGDSLEAQLERAKKVSNAAQEAPDYLDSFK